MSYTLVLGIFKRSIVFAFAITALTVALASNAKALSTTWKIKIDVSSGNEKPSYSVTPPANTHNCAGANPSPAPSAEYLYICAGDSVQWEVKTKGGNGKLSVYQKDLFLYKGAAQAQWFHAKEGQSDGGTTDVNTPKGQVHEYSVAVFDDDSANPHLYVHDPKIIIGTGIVDEVVRDMASVCKAKSTESDAKNVATRLCKDVKTLMSLLNLD